MSSRGSGGRTRAGRSFTHKQFEVAMASRRALGERGGHQETGIITMQGRDYFVKRVEERIDERMSANKEMAAAAVARVVGLEDRVVPIWPEKYDNSRWLVSPHIDGSQVGRVPVAAYGIIQRIPRDTRARMVLYDYVIGDSDRHTKQYMVQNGTGHVFAIDHGLAFQPDLTFSLFADEGFGRAAMGRNRGMDSWRNFVFTRADLEHFTSRSNEIIATANRYGVRQGNLRDPIRQRLNILGKALSQKDSDGNPVNSWTANDIERLSRSLY